MDLLSFQLQIQESDVKAVISHVNSQDDDCLKAVEDLYTLYIMSMI